MLSQEDNPKTHRLNREISCETGIHWLTVRKIIFRDLQLNCVKQRRAQQLSETTSVIALPVWLAASSCCKMYSLTSYGLGMKSGYRRTTNIQLAERSGLCTNIDNRKQHIDPSCLLRMSVMASVAVSQVELIFVNHGVKVNGQYYCNVLLSQQMFPAIIRVAERCLITKQCVYGDIGHILCSVISPR